MALFSKGKIIKDDFALINVLRQEKNESSERLVGKFTEKYWAMKTWTNC